MDGQAQVIISALATTLTGVVTAVIKYLLNENKDLKQALKEANASTSATNETNAKLAALLPDVLAQKEALQRQLSSPVREGRS